MKLDSIVARWQQTHSTADGIAIMEGCEKAINYFVCRYAHQLHPAEELREEAIVAVFEAANVFKAEHGNKFITLVSTYIRNAILEYMKRNVSATKYTRNDVETILYAEVEDPYEVADRHKMKQITEVILAQYPSQVGEAFRMRHYQDMTFAAIARKTGQHRVHLAQKYRVICERIATEMTKGHRKHGESRHNH